MKRIIFFISLLIIGLNYSSKAQKSASLDKSGRLYKESKQSQKDFKVTHGPYLQNIGETTATLVWTTSSDAISWVELAPNDSSHFYKKKRKKHFDTRYGLKRTDSLHAVRIQNLEPGTQYRYRIFSKKVISHNGKDVRYGDIVATGVFKQEAPSFTTTNSSAKNLSFLVLNDIHERNKVMKILLNNGGWKDTNLIFFNGDMVNSLRSKRQLFASFMDTAVQMFAGEIPMYYARGNHEARGRFAGSYSQYFPSPNDKPYYMLRKGPVAFLVLDSGEDKPDSDIEYSSIASFDNYRTKEATWLKEVTQKSEFREAPFKVAIIHMPPFGGWHGEEEVKEKFVPLLNKAGIDVMFSGHLHRYVHRNSSGEKWNFPVIVNSNNTVLRAEIMNRNKLKIQVINQEKDIIDSLMIRAHKSN